VQDPAQVAIRGLNKKCIFQIFFMLFLRIKVGVSSHKKPSSERMLKN
jgi:hypothetical protein